MQTNAIRILALAAILLAGAALPAQAHEFTEGYYFTIGTVSPAGFSFFMQGSHVLEADPGYAGTRLRSDAYDLSLYEGKRVKVSGWVEHTVEGHAVIMDVWTITVLEPWKPTAFAVFSSGDKSGYHPTKTADRFFAIRDAATWELFHRVHRPADKVPSVDFKKYQVLAAYMGPKHQAANSITITKVEKLGATLKVKTHSTTPPPDSKMPVFATPIFPYALAVTWKTSGSVYFDGVKGRIATATDFKAPKALLAVGELDLTGMVDRSKLKVGVFNMLINAKYFQWPGNHPYDVAMLDAFHSDLFTVQVKPVDDSVNHYRRYTVIVWEDLNDDNSPAGELQATSDSFRWMGGESWTDSDGNPVGKHPHVVFELTRE